MQIAGSLQVSCWASCLHDAVGDWLQEPTVAADVGEDAAGSTATTEKEQSWGAATAPVVGGFDLVFAANAGLPAYPSWLPTLQQLLQWVPPAGAGHSHRGSTKGVPIVFSDYCEEAAYMSGQLVEQVFGKAFTLASCLNPFRDPVPATTHGTRLPACSNAYLFGWV